MTITIRRDETDRLVRELAEMQGVSLADAVHLAVQEKLLCERRKESPACELWSSDCEELLESDPDAAAAIAVDERRLLIAREFGMDKGIYRLVDDIWSPALFMTLALFLAPFFERPRHSVSLGIIVLDAIFWIFYSRHLSRQEVAREQSRQRIANEIASLRTSLPQGLMFLTRIPDIEPDYGLLEKSDIVHGGRGTV